MEQNFLIHLLSMILFKQNKNSWEHCEYVELLIRRCYVRKVCIVIVYLMFNLKTINKQNKPEINNNFYSKLQHTKIDRNDYYCL